MPSSLAILLAGLTLVSMVGCSSAEAAPAGVTTIPRRDAADDRDTSVVEAERLAARACDCEDSRCASAAADDFAAYVRELGVPTSKTTALASAAERVRNCEAHHANGTR